MPSTPRKSSKPTAKPKPQAQIAESMPASPGAAMQEEIPYSPDSTQEGAVYVYRGGVSFIAKVIDADEVLKVLKNHLVKKNKLKLKRLIFRDHYQFRILDPKGNVDEELGKRLHQVFDAPKVNLWSKMMMAWNDIMDWGPALFNPVWEKVGGEWVLAALRHLPAESFSVPAPKANHEFSELLPGIVLDEATGEVQFWQSIDMTSNPRPIKNVFMIKDPTCSQIAGESQVESVVGLVREYNFCRKVQMQQCNRIGAQNIFIKFKRKPSKREIDWANNVLEHWGNNTAFTLLENMDAEGIDVTETRVAVLTVDDVRKEIDDYFSPSSMIKRQQGSLGSTGSAEVDQTNDFVLGWHSVLEEGCRTLPQMYLDLNGYDGYQAFIDIPPPKQDRSEVQLKQATVGYQTKALKKNEIRVLLEHEALDEKGLEELEAEYPAAPATVVPFGNKEDVPERIAERSDPLEKDIGEAYDDMAMVFYKGLQQLETRRAA
ncbi:MAG: hypothetical protein LLG45_13385 [Actinomycetia bacterium]|nr:hypothetical protein [Actinomycetes bacterium]